MKLSPNALVAIVAPIYVVFLTAFTYFYLTRFRIQTVRKRFFRALKEILLADKDLASQEKQLNLVYKKISENFSAITAKMRGVLDLIEDFVYFFDARGPEILKSLYRVDVDRSLRDQAYLILMHIREANPFSSLPAKEANLLRTLSQAVESTNKELGNSTLRQLAEEIEILDASIKSGERRTRISYVISFVGVILTFVFGITSIFQVIRR